MSTMFPREPGIWCGPGIRCRNWKTSGLELNEIKGKNNKIIDQHRGLKALFQFSIQIFLVLQQVFRYIECVPN